MGTRHLINVVYGGQLVISQYGQWDGYPTGQGEDVCDFIREEYWYNRLKEKAQKKELKFLSSQDAAVLDDIIFPKEDKKKKTKPRSEVVQDVLATMFRESHFSRDRGAGILKMAAREIGDFYTIDERDFEHSTIFTCEYVHLLNLDKDTYTIYVPSASGVKKTKTYRVSSIRKWGDKKVHNEMHKLEDSWKDKEE